MPLLSILLDFDCFRGFKNVMVLLFVLLFAGVGIMHFTHTSLFIKIVPPFIPMKALVVYLSGIFEIIGALGLLIPSYRRVTAYFLVLLLVAVFPANIYHVASNIQLGGIMNIPFIQWARLPFQLVLIWLLLWATK